VQQKVCSFGGCSIFSIGPGVLGHFDDVQQKMDLGSSVRCDLFPAYLLFQEDECGALGWR
jgi:hypothetical protein